MTVSVRRTLEMAPFADNLKVLAGLRRSHKTPFSGPLSHGSGADRLVSGRVAGYREWVKKFTPPVPA
jgi:hypothetical protein